MSKSSRTFTSKFGHHLMVIITVSQATISCKTAEDNGSVKDVGLINAVKSESMVVYEDQGKVYLRNCKPLTSKPIRACASSEAPRSMLAEDYINKLPYNVTPYTRDEQSLAALNEFIETTRSAAQAGNQQAAQTLSKLELIKKNLEMVLKIRKDLASQQMDLTYYEYHDEFAKLLMPFYPNGSPENGGSGSDPNPTTPVPTDPGRAPSGAISEVPIGTMFKFRYNERTGEDLMTGYVLQTFFSRGSNRYGSHTFKYQMPLGCLSLADNLGAFPQITAGMTASLIGNEVIQRTIAVSASKTVSGTENLLTLRTETGYEFQIECYSFIQGNVDFSVAPTVIGFLLRFAELSRGSN